MKEQTNNRIVIYSSVIGLITVYQTYPNSFVSFLLKAYIVSELMFLRRHFCRHKSHHIFVDKFFFFFRPLFWSG
jgi:hypothetical protein